MKNYDNYFLPVDNMEEAKRYYEEILGLKRNLISLIREWLLIILEMKNLQ
jgi:predicted enzyme related to lactoylglutathione lyase